MEVPSKASFKNWPHRPGQQIRTFIMAGVYVSYLLGTKGTSLIFFPSPNLLFCLNSLISPPSLVLTSHDPALRKHPGLSVAGPIPEHQGQELTSDRNLSPLHLGFISQPEVVAVLTQPDLLDLGAAGLRDLGAGGGLLCSWGDSSSGQ